MTHLDFATDLARQAGVIITQNFQLGMKKEWKGDGTPLTATDMQVNQLALDAVATTFPDHAVLAEEGSHLIEGAEWTWICDPVGGTFPFAHGVPTSVFSLALAQGSVIELGLLYDPFLDRMVVAERGQGSILNGRACHVSSLESLQSAALAVVARGSDTSLHELVCTLKHSGVRLIDPQAMQYIALLVAIGAFDGIIAKTTEPNDFAALSLLVPEAGGRVTDLAGRDQRYDEPISGFIATNGHVHDELVALVGQHLKQA